MCNSRHRQPQAATAAAVQEASAAATDDRFPKGRQIRHWSSSEMIDIVAAIEIIADAVCTDALLESCGSNLRKF